MGVQTIFNFFPKFAYNLIIVLYQTEVTKWYRFIQMQCTYSYKATYIQSCTVYSKLENWKNCFKKYQLMINDCMYDGTGAYLTH